MFDEQLQLVGPRIRKKDTSLKAGHLHRTFRSRRQNSQSLL